MVISLTTSTRLLAIEIEIKKDISNFFVIRIFIARTAGSFSKRVLMPASVLAVAVDLAADHHT
jgi:hypothetical protein